MAPINIIVLVVTVIESLRAFDLVWVINKGRNGLELISTLVTQNIVGEASRIGFGSALAALMLVISSVLVAFYLRFLMRREAMTAVHDAPSLPSVEPPGSDCAGPPRPAGGRCRSSSRRLLLWLFPVALGASSTRSATMPTRRSTATCPSAASPSRTT